MSALIRPTVLANSVPQTHSRFLNPTSAFHGFTFPRIRIRCLPVCRSTMESLEPSPVTLYASPDDAGDKLVKGTSNFFETLKSEVAPETLTSTGTEKEACVQNQPSVQLQYLKWPMWILGPSLLLVTSVVPTLWLPLSSIYLGPNIASILSLIGLDCVFNLGATLFLLMADSCAQPKDTLEDCTSRTPSSYQFWNIVASVTGFFIPLLMLLGSQKGYLEPKLPFISFAVLLGPYILLLSIQVVTETLTWHWKSPVWLVTPVVYESYRLLQLMRGLKLSAELNAPVWVVTTIRTLVCWWVLILGMQLMRVAWFAGFSARASVQEEPAVANGG